jgi:hypothetical protein
MFFTSGWVLKLFAKLNSKEKTIRLTKKWDEKYHDFVQAQVLDVFQSQLEGMEDCADFSEEPGTLMR